MFIPGTHDSGSYAGVSPLVENYVLNQDRNVWTQLVSGIRYLDFRIGYYNREGFFINHDLIRVTRIGPILQEIRKFLELAPKEIVVVDFHRFPYPTNFSHEIHRQFVDILYKELGQFALPSWQLQSGEGPTLNDIWARNRNLIICYAEREIVRDNQWLWSPLQQFWGDTNKVPELKRYLERTIREQRPVSPNPMWALMAELTPTPLDIIFRTNSLKKLAQEINGEVTKWFRDEWVNETNIVATDYFLGNDLINVAIHANVAQGILKV
ncbi:unnamed protein product [Acanthoscelides obtectus]|uniref:Uncharacterized protein n=1 Tax=Acanthoscelides obtectus TaxID=200917 RepID=A0A9P0KLR2_ACAOB|nr:unnamed protein product [Acanthoscelides obtectus]CAK1674911.1 PI-PLC X domain-containing protein 1 [Acanthoscelides obtectus]